MKFTEFTIVTTSEAQELVADILWQYTTYGVAVCDKRDVIELIENRRSTFDYIDEELEKQSDKCAFVKAYVELGESQKVAALLNDDLTLLKANAAGNIAVGTLELTSRVVEGDDWIAVWKKHFRPINYGKITVCPKWIKYDKRDGEEVVYIDSNAAFGTGEHETTSMCIEYLEKYLSAGETLVDIGTGSGILGIAGVKLGFSRAVMTDIDPVSVLSAKHNAEINGVSDKCEIYRSDLVEGVERVGGVAVANITAEILVRLTADINKKLKRGGVLIMSGIIKERLGFVLDNFEKAGFKLLEKREKGEWLAVVMQSGSSGISASDCGAQKCENEFAATNTCAQKSEEKTV